MKNYISGSACEVFIDSKNKKVIKRVQFENEGVENGYHKLLNEIIYLKKMNQECTFFPRLISSYNKDNYLYMELEYMYQGLSLADLIFDDSIDTNYLLQSLKCVLNSLFKDFYITQNSKLNADYWYDCYINRTIRRLDISLQLMKERSLNWTNLTNCILHGITINGIYYESAYKYMNYLYSHMKSTKGFNLQTTYRSHHDLIPENILVQRENLYVSDFKLIDPRRESETGVTNRHYIYDMGKMLFGLDCYGLFRRSFRSNFESKLFYFDCIDPLSYKLSYNINELTVRKLMESQKCFLHILESCTENIKKEGNIKLQLMFSAACMYIPDIPCRIIDENNEKLCLLFYARGCMLLHELMLMLYGFDELSSDKDGSQYSRWPNDLN